MNIENAHQSYSHESNMELNVDSFSSQSYNNNISVKHSNINDDYNDTKKISGLYN